MTTTWNKPFLCVGNTSICNSSYTGTDENGFLMNNDILYQIFNA